MEQNIFFNDHLVIQTKLFLTFYSLKYLPKIELDSIIKVNSTTNNVKTKIMTNSTNSLFDSKLSIFSLAL